jgi:uncharacterized protein (TIGR03067 family)
MMTQARWMGLALAATIWATSGALGDEKEKVSDDLKALQGTWVTAPDAVTEARWVFDGEKLKTTVNGQDYVSKIKLDTKSNPRAVDFNITEGPEDSAGKTVVGIYKIDGDKLSICIAAPGRDTRPTEFKVIEEQTFLFELKREKKS